MTKTGRWATVISVVCGAELAVAIVIGGAGLAALFSIETVLLATPLGGVLLWVIHDRRRRRGPTEGPDSTSTTSDDGAPEPSLSKTQRS